MTVATIQQEIAHLKSLSLYEVLTGDFQFVVRISTVGYFVLISNILLLSLSPLVYAQCKYYCRKAAPYMREVSMCCPLVGYIVHEDGMHSRD